MSICEICGKWRKPKGRPSPGYGFVSQNFVNGVQSIQVVVGKGHSRTVRYRCSGVPYDQRARFRGVCGDSSMFAFAMEHSLDIIQLRH